MVSVGQWEIQIFYIEISGVNAQNNISLESVNFSHIWITNVHAYVVTRELSCWSSPQDWRLRYSFLQKVFYCIHFLEKNRRKKRKKKVINTRTVHISERANFGSGAIGSCKCDLEGFSHNGIKLLFSKFFKFLKLYWHKSKFTIAMIIVIADHARLGTFSQCICTQTRITMMANSIS